MKIRHWIAPLVCLCFPAAWTWAADLTQLQRKIGREPAYASKPQYCLSAFGPNSEARVWLVLDSDTLYVDRNANGDLTDDGERVAAKKDAIREPVFSPNGEWLAVITQLFPEELQGPEADAKDLPQPRIHLVDVAAVAVRETLVAPQGVAVALCFSPDGQTLATGGHGKVLLWDLTKPSGL